MVFRSSSMPVRIPQAKFEAILPKDVKGDTFLPVADRWQEVFSLCRINFLLFASMTLILVFFNYQWIDLSKHVYF